MSEGAESVPTWTLGWRLKRALSYADLSAQDMAAELGVHVATVSRWMNDRETPRRAYIMAWSLRTGVPIDWFVRDDELPRVDSNHQPAGLLSDDPSSHVTRDEILAFRKTIRPRVRARAL